MLGVLLNKINGRLVEIVGGLLYLASVALFFLDLTGVILAGLFALYELARRTRAFSFLAKIPGQLWDEDSIHTWPAFVAMSVAMLVASGHPHARWIIASVATVFDGMYFDPNY